MVRKSLYGSSSYAFPELEQVKHTEHAGWKTNSAQGQRNATAFGVKATFPLCLAASLPKIRNQGHPRDY